ncbi:MAG: hypothetical protein LBK44_03720, partial [Spirochaetales bacterium]|nr:hypothetical protein [Spirochaetales bacterium]
FSISLGKPGKLFRIIVLCAKYYQGVSMKILESSEDLKYYTDMNIIMKPFKNDFIKYNWLITDYECNYYPKGIIEPQADYIWVNGERLYEIQFIWSVFSGFIQNILFEKVMEYELPESEYYAHWKNKNDTQNPLADIEIVSWDSSCLLFKSKNEDYINKFKEIFPLSKEI